jgi:hypothetical protein
MLVTITNASASAINGLQQYSSGEGIGPAACLAEGGQRSTPLPWPFGHVGEIAASGTKQLPMHPRDFGHRDVMVGSPFTASEELQQLVQQGVVTVAVAAETGFRDVEEDFLATL